MELGKMDCFMAMFKSSIKMQKSFQGIISTTRKTEKAEFNTKMEPSLKEFLKMIEQMGSEK